MAIELDGMRASYAADVFVRAQQRNLLERISSRICQRTSHSCKIFDDRRSEVCWLCIKSEDEIEAAIVFEISEEEGISREDWKFTKVFAAKPEQT